MKFVQAKFATFLMSLACAAVSSSIQADSSDPNGAIQQALNDLNQYQALQVQVGIQNADLSYAMRKALVLADLLIDPSGTLQVALTQPAKAAFVPSQSHAYEKHISNILDHLSASLQPSLDKILKPADPNSVSNTLLRAFFSLGPNDEITDRHAKVAVLAALFAPYNQGPVGDCFAVSDLIRDHDEFCQHCGRDCAEAIHLGYLVREVGSAPDNFFFLPTIADSDTSNPFTIDSSGNITNANVTILQAPGLAAASKIMGGDSVANLLPNTVTVLYQGNSTDNSIQVTASQVITALAQTIGANSSTDAQNGLACLGSYAFSSLTNNPLMRATESAFAAMAEDSANDSTRGNINSCVAQALASTWQQLGSSSDVTNFQTAFTNNFNSLYRLVYNPNIPLAQPSADGSSTDGGFQLYLRDSNNPSSIGTRLATPQDFENLVLQAIALTQSQGGSASVASTLSNFVQNGTFLRDALCAYDSNNQQDPDPVADYAKLRTPMQSCDGDNPYAVDDVDTGKTYDGNVQTFTVKNAGDLLKHCLDMAPKAPKELLPMNSPQHAFNFDPTNPDIVAFLKSKLSSDAWIKQIILTQGMKVATRPIDAQLRTNYANAIGNIIAQQVPNDTSAYNALVAKLAKQKLTIQKYAQSLYSGVAKILGASATGTDDIAALLDGILLQVLNPNDQAVITNGATRFAFTNWNDGVKNIYFCGYFNIRTGQVSFGSIDDDKTNLQPMAEAEWVINQQWDVDLSPYAPSCIRHAS